ncbi:hypothetical protein V8F06_006110 [Rhypophila decipiens]
MVSPLTSPFPILPLHIRPITYQSGENTFSEWITLFTLCLAPLVAHIIAGVPEVSCLSRHRPRWQDRICHYNPISILWRYAAITDRRIRARSWDAADLAASNTLFWTSNGWDGSEQMADSTLPFCSRLPENTRVAFFSGDMVKTLIVTLQGCQVVFMTINIFKLTTLDENLPPFSARMGLDIIFFHIALIGLMRIFCCLWLTQDFSYSNVLNSGLDKGRVYDRSLGSFNTHLDISADVLGGGMDRRWSADTIRRPRLTSPTFPIIHTDPSSTTGSWKYMRTHSRYWATNTWPSRAFRFFFLTILLGLWTIAMLIAISSMDVTATAFLALVFYHFLLGSAIILLSIYFVQGKTTTTIIPCISSNWYKVHTAVTFLVAISLFVVGCIETRQTPCGTFTSYPGYMGDLMGCLKKESLPIRVNTGKVAEPPPVRLGTLDIPEGFGIGFFSPLSRDPRQFVMMNFTGTCLGNLSTVSAQLAKFEVR